MFLPHIFSHSLFHIFLFFIIIFSLLIFLSIPIIVYHPFHIFSFSFLYISIYMYTFFIHFSFPPHHRLYILTAERIRCLPRPSCHDGTRNEKLAQMDRALRRQCLHSTFSPSTNSLMLSYINKESIVRAPTRYCEDNPPSYRGRRNLKVKSCTTIWIHWSLINQGRNTDSVFNRPTGLKVGRFSWEKYLLDRIDTGTSFPHFISSFLLYLLFSVFTH